MSDLIIQLPRNKPQYPVSRNAKRAGVPLEPVETVSVQFGVRRPQARQFSAVGELHRSFAEFFHISRIEADPLGEGLADAPVAVLLLVDPCSAWKIYATEAFKSSHVTVGYQLVVNEVFLHCRVPLPPSF